MLPMVILHERDSPCLSTPSIDCSLWKMAEDQLLSVDQRLNTFYRENVWEGKLIGSGPLAISLAWKEVMVLVWKLWHGFQARNLVQRRELPTVSGECLGAGDSEPVQPKLRFLAQFTDPQRQAVQCVYQNPSLSCLL